jgi:ADP-L-glycero-D-manno-heptose 6-epimerase
MPKAALVTGATGFIGSHLCKRLHENGYLVHAVGTNRENIPPCVKLYKVPLNEIPWDKLPKIDICFHLGANNNTKDPDFERMYEANVVQSSLLFEMVHNLKNCKQIVYASSCSIYGKQKPPYREEFTKPKPLTAYARSKLLLEETAEQFSEENDVVVVGLRYSNVYGPGESHKHSRASMVHQIMETVLKGKKPSLFRWGEQTRDWVYVEDVVNANLLASESVSSGIYNVGSGESRAFQELLQYMSEIVGRTITANYIDCEFQDWYQSETGLNLDYIKKHLGYQPRWTTFEGMKDMYKKIGGK